MLNTICTRKEKNTGIFIFRDLQNGINMIQFGELLRCARTTLTWPKLSFPWMLVGCWGNLFLFFIDWFDYLPVVSMYGRRLSLGVLIRSLCEMRRRTCGQHVIAVGLHHCAATKSCNITCHKHKIRSVCASDGNIYRNACEMQAKNCG